MRVIPGSHDQGGLTHRDTFAADNLLTRGQEIAVSVDAARAVDLVLQPGEMSLHHVGIVHGSDPNTSAIPRIGFAIPLYRDACPADRRTHDGDPGAWQRCPWSFRSGTASRCGQ